MINSRVWCLWAGGLAMIASLGSAATEPEQVKNHRQLQDALKENQPPSGYIDLSRCSTEAVVGNVPNDQQTYRLSFRDHFSFNLESKIITSVFDTVLNSSQRVGGTPLFVKVPATVFVTSSPDNNYLRYQITLGGGDSNQVRLYHCLWDKAVYLWR